MNEHLKLADTRPSNAMDAAWIGFGGAVVGALIGAVATYAAAHSQTVAARDQAKEAKANLDCIRDELESVRHKLDEVAADLQQRDEEVRAYEEAPHVFADRLGDLIRRAATRQDTEVDARAIVKMRNDLAAPLKGLGAALNHEIDELEAELRRKASAEALRKTISVLNKTWAAKRDQIELQMRQLQLIFKTTRRESGDEARRAPGEESGEGSDT